MPYPLLPPRPRDSHKGLFGHIGVIGGAPGMVGAALLAGRAALMSGAGRVTLGMLDAAIHVDFVNPELMFAPAADLAADARLTAVAIGPGLGQAAPARAALDTALHHRASLLIDADALNLLAADTALAEACRQRAAPTLLTPHPGEAARLLAISVTEVQRDREQSARELADRFKATVALKGSGTVVAAPDGRLALNPTGNPALSAPGMGDVLTGIAAAFLARLPPWDALQAAVWLHGRAADEAVASGIGPEGLTASELIEFTRSQLNRADPKST